MNMSIVFACKAIGISESLLHMIARSIAEPLYAFCISCYLAIRTGSNVDDEQRHGTVCGCFSSLLIRFRA